MAGEPHTQVPESSSGPAPQSDHTLASQASTESSVPDLGPETRHEMRKPRWWLRELELLLGAWLFVSTFLWPHPGGSRRATWVTGIAIAVFSVVASSRPRLRIANALLGAWLLLSTLLVFNSSRETVWNNMVVGLIVLTSSLYPRSE